MQHGAGQFQMVLRKRIISNVHAFNAIHSHQNYQFVENISQKENKEHGWVYA